MTNVSRGPIVIHTDSSIVLDIDAGLNCWWLHFDLRCSDIDCTACWQQVALRLRLRLQLLLAMLPALLLLLPLLSVRIGLLSSCFHVRDQICCTVSLKGL